MAIKSRTKPITDNELVSLLTHEISQAHYYRQSDQDVRFFERAIDYLRGIMPDLPAATNRSKVVSRDVGDTINWIMPSLMRVFTASDQLGVFEPVREGDEAGAKQATEYINYKFWKENDGYRICWDLLHDSLLTRNGIVKHWWDDSERKTITVHSNQTPENMTVFEMDPTCEIKAADLDEETGLYELEVERNQPPRLQLEAIAVEDFLINDEAEYLDEHETRFCAHRRLTTRSDMIEMGFDRETVDNLPAFTDIRTDEVKTSRDTDHEISKNSVIDNAQQLIELFECYILTDATGNGVSNRVRAWYAGTSSAGTLLDWEIWDNDLPFTDFVPNRLPHRFEGLSITDETEDIQRIKTTLLRQALDNTYASTNPQREAEEGSVINPNELVNPSFGGILWKKKASLPIQQHVVQYTADKSFAALDYFDQVIVKRTGAGPNTMPLDPEALQNQTATSVQKQADAAYSRIELFARNLAEMGGFKRLFRCMLRIYVKNMDRVDTIRLRDEWVPMDPRSWNADMDVTVNVGLGTGSRDRDMAMLNTVLQNQILITKEMQNSGFAEAALAMLPKIQKTLVQISESAGIKNADTYYLEFGPEQLNAMLQRTQEMQSQPNPAAQAAQAKLQLEQAKAQSDAQLDQQKAVQDAQLEQQKLDAEIALKREQMQAEIELKREQLAAEMALKREQLQAELMLKAVPSANGGLSDVQMGGMPG